MEELTEETLYNLRSILEAHGYKVEPPETKDLLYRNSIEVLEECNASNRLINTLVQANIIGSDKKYQNLVDEFNKRKDDKTYEHGFLQFRNYGSKTHSKLLEILKKTEVI